MTRCLVDRITVGSVMGRFGIVLLFLALLLQPATGAERRPMSDIPIAELVNETSHRQIGAGFIDVVWWIPTEYWEANLSQHRMLTAAPKDAIEKLLRSFFMLAVIQADGSPSALDFFTEEQTRNGLAMTYSRLAGPSASLRPLDKINPEASLLQQQVLKPQLAVAMGDLGKNMRFFTYGDVDLDEKRIVSPFEPGRLKISLSRRDGSIRSVFNIELPLNSLFVPRLCPNGKPAQVSWKYCPWDGTKLPD